MIRALQLSDIIGIAGAAGWTFVLSLLAFVGSAAVGLIMATLRLSAVTAVRWTAIVYTQIVQGTPLLVWLFLLYFGVTTLGFNINAWLSVTIAFSVYGGAFLGEIWFGALKAVPKTQWEAGSSLGLSYLQQFTRIILPQSVRIAIPPTVGFAVQLIKNTSLASTIGVYELTQAGVFIAGATYRPLAVYSIVALIYLIICYPLTRWSRALERKLDVARRS
jgi:polar amino acid transport system permease protein